MVLVILRGFLGSLSLGWGMGDGINWVKYAVGQEVWYIDCTYREGPICSAKIGSISSFDELFGEKKYYAELSTGLLVPINCLYPSEQELIDAQIEYLESRKMGVSNENTRF